MAARERFCFVTVGATAAFDALVRSVLQPSFLRALAKQGYTNLLIQFGKDGKDLFTGLAEVAGKSGTYALKVQGFDLTSKLRETMRITKGEAGRLEGVVVCHAGTLLSASAAP
jgi:beta-1,4-N-acetylglucosaminyltransferase